MVIEEIFILITKWGFQGEINPPNPPSWEMWWILKSLVKTWQQLRDMDTCDSPPSTTFTKPELSLHLYSPPCTPQGNSRQEA